MKSFKRTMFVSLLIVLSLFVAESGWSQTVGLPHAGFGGWIQTFLDNGTGDDLIFIDPITTIDSVVYSDGTLGTSDSIIGAKVVLTGAKRSPLATPGTTFTDATISITDGVTTYFSATLRNIEFVLVDGLWRLNPDLDVNNPPTMNLENILLNPGPIPSQYILDLQNKLGSQSIAGMTMTLNVLSGDITGDSFTQILEGIIDGVPAAAPNSPPTADAGATTTNVQCTTSPCEINLDGSQSSDPDSSPGTNDDIVSFEWFEGGTLIATGQTVTVSLPLGMHDITLRVTDSAGATDEATITVVIDPAELSFFEIERAHVKRDGKVKIAGKLALPAGVSHFNLSSVGRAIIGISTLGNVIDESVDFTENSDNTKWKYDANPALGLKKFKIDWKGSKFSYKDDIHEILMKTHHIGDNETALEIRSCTPITVTINGISITIDENDNVTASSSSVKVDGDDDGDSDEDDSDHGNSNDNSDDCAIQVKLPFALTPDMTIYISGSVTETILVGDYYSSAVGRFRIEGRFDAAGIDFSSLTPLLQLTVALGDEGFSGTLVIDEATWTKIKPKHWNFKLK